MITYDKGPASGLPSQEQKDVLRSSHAELLGASAPGPYVINLSTSNAPFSIPGKVLQELSHLHIYQVQRAEEGRTRYRLRLGPISSELEADAILAGVRQNYPVAQTAAAGEDDLRAIAIAASVGARTKPTLVKKQAALNVGPSIGPAPVRRISDSVGRYTEIRPDPLLAVDSTLTLRAISAIELAEDQPSQSFVIQLAVGETAFQAQDVLNLDIFKEFSLYSTISLGEGRVLHALRLGFFKGQSAADTVASYVRRYFEASSVMRVSVAERERFAERRVHARKTSEATGVHEVIELSSPAPVPATNLSVLSRAVAGQDTDHQSPWRGKPTLKR